MAIQEEIIGVILAGGQARRMGGGDKGLLRLNGKPMIRYVYDRLRPQVHSLLINANRNIETYQHYAPVIEDSIPDYAGPLAGMLAGLETIKHGYLLSVPCDSPFLPNDLATRMLAAARENTTLIAVASDGQRLQPVFSLLHHSLRDSLAAYLASGERKIDRWYAQQQYSRVDFSDHADTFININCAEELAQISQQIAKGTNHVTSSQ